MRVGLTFVGLAIFTGQACAGSPQLDDCMAHVDFGAFKNTQWTECYNQELARQDRQLNEEYRKLLAQAREDSEEAAKALVMAQRQWLAFRTAWCSYAGKTSSAPSPGVNQAACMAEFTAAQVIVLKNSVY